MPCKDHWLLFAVSVRFLETSKLLSDKSPGFRRSITTRPVSAGASTGFTDCLYYSLEKSYFLDDEQTGQYSYSLGHADRFHRKYV
jgi:hypothetical protein